MYCNTFYALKNNHAFLFVNGSIITKIAIVTYVKIKSDILSMWFLFVVYTQNVLLCEFVIRWWVETARSAIMQQTKVWKNRNIAGNTKSGMLAPLQFSTFLDFLLCFKTLFIRFNNRKQIDAFEAGVWSKMLRISWTVKGTNASTLNTILPAQRFLSREEILKFFDHTSRHENTEKLIAQKISEGTRKRDRSLTQWTHINSKLTNSKFCLSTFLQVLKNHLGCFIFFIYIFQADVFCVLSFLFFPCKKTFLMKYLYHIFRNF